MKNCSKIQSAFLIAPLVWLSVISNFLPSSNCQEEVRPKHSDWVTSMPVSLNGKLPVSSLWHQGLELVRWHDSIPADDAFVNSWKPEFFFDDPLVVDLCKAIFVPDVTEMKRLIAKGADVKKIGKDGMTPLYWAFHMKSDPGPFELLLKSGADPNVIVNYTKERPVIQTVLSGYSVTNLVTRGLYNRQFKNVFEHGGDPNLLNENSFSGSPAFWELWADAPDAAERLQILIDRGADLDRRHPEYQSTFVMGQVGEYENYNRLALIVLEGGANYHFFYKQKERFRKQPGPFEGCYFRLIHILAEAETKVSERPADQQTHYRAVVAWLEEHGESLAKAKEDLKRWKEWKRTGQPELIEAEHQKRLAQEKERKPVAVKPDK